MSFKGTNPKIRLGILYTNNLFNSDAKFEVLEGVNMIDIIKKKNDKDYWLRDYLLEVKVDNVHLFIAVEQGGGKHSKDAIIIVAPHAKMLARK